MLLTTVAAPLAKVPPQPKYLLLGGFLVAFYVLSVTWIAPRFGVGNAVFCVLLGQMLAASVIDHFGLFGAVARPLSSCAPQASGSWPWASSSPSAPENE